MIEKDGKKTLDLKKFNDNLEIASNNLGEIVPGIAQISKEQVALINHGLEGTINFISSFQTLNTAFAVFAEKPTISTAEKPEESMKELLKNSQTIKELEDLEGFILKDISSSLVNMESMLNATFKEVAGYYTALANIIYSEDESGEIVIDYKRNRELENFLDEVMGKDRKRTININGEEKDIKRKHTLKKSLGLVQIIQSLVDVSKEIEKVDIKIDDKTKKKLKRLILQPLMVKK